METNFSHGGISFQTRPRLNTAKSTPPTIPVGVPYIFAGLIVSGEEPDHRPFIVPLNDSTRMYTGVELRLLLYRGATNLITPNDLYSGRSRSPRVHRAARQKIRPPARCIPILSFRTQHTPIFTVTVNVYVMHAMQRWAIGWF
ncbi:hypothetical protein LXA43DRAFT_1099328 [Ganoderma leucocontextum]|nr:hypothetical protein LXA43DRAFT_1099328 [Ganoderma leucocontextum]